VTEAALRGAKAVVVLWSPRSVVSRWVRAEATVGDRNRTLVPARIEACDLPIMFELTQTAELTHWQGDGADRAWKAFLGDVRRMVEAKAEAEQPAASTQTAARPARGRKPSIAVLPFINRSGLAEDDIFADGMVEELTSALSLSKRMKVIAASATAAYREGARDLRQIGRDLGVRYLLEGNIRRVGEDLRVTAQLVEAEDGNILWTQKFDRPLAQVAVLQEELVAELAAHMGVQVDRAETEHALRKPGDISAWEAVLRANAYLGEYTQTDSEAAVAEARRAIEIDPDYDLAHATFAIAYTALFIHSGRTDKAAMEESLRSAERAITFRSSDPFVLARIGAALTTGGRPEDGHAYAARAVSLNPNLKAARIALGGSLMSLGRWDDALRQFDEIERIAPNGLYSHSGVFIGAIAHFCAGRAEAALARVERALVQAPVPQAQVLKILCLLTLDDSAGARQALRHLHSMFPDISLARAEMLVRDAICPSLAPDRTEKEVAALRVLWDET